MQVILPEFSVRFFYLSMQKLYVGMVVVFFDCTRACVCRCDGDVICVGHDLNWCS